MLCERVVYFLLSRMRRKQEKDVYIGKDTISNRNFLGNLSHKVTKGTMYPNSSESEIFVPLWVRVEQHSKAPICPK